MSVLLKDLTFISGLNNLLTKEITCHTKNKQTSKKQFQYSIEYYQQKLLKGKRYRTVKESNNTYMTKVGFDQHPDSHSPV